MAFQIRDDILDICGTEEELGKPPGSDIRQGNITLPFILGLRSHPERERIAAYIEALREAPGAADPEPLLALIRGSRELREAEELSYRYADKAIRALGRLPDCTARRQLAEIARFVVNRSY